MEHRSVVRIMFALVAAGAMVVQAAPAQAGTFRGSFHQTNLVSDLPGMAQLRDPDLVNPWGLSSSPTSPIWVSDNNAAVSTLYNGAGQKVPLTVHIPAPGDPQGGPFTGTPTGTVFNPTTDFKVSNATTSARSLFLFGTEDGTILGWNPGVGGNVATIAVDHSATVDTAGDVGAVYKGLTNGSVGSANFLYAANFRFGTVDVFDGNFAQVVKAGAFTDSSIPSGFAPFGIQNIGGLIYVTYAKQDQFKHDDMNGPGNGFVDVYTTSGALVRRLASHGTLNSPWGLALAPSTFGNFHDAILVGNFGDGFISGFLPDGTFRGQLKSETNAPIQNDGLWGLRFGNGGAGGDPNKLFFSAGIFDESHGLFGTIQNVED
jgi:uncharacterized protein (TIGR03118 family)